MLVHCLRNLWRTHALVVAITHQQLQLLSLPLTLILYIGASDGSMEYTTAAFNGVAEISPRHEPRQPQTKKNRPKLQPDRRARFTESLTRSFYPVLDIHRCSSSSSSSSQSLAVCVGWCRCHRCRDHFATHELIFKDKKNKQKQKQTNKNKTATATCFVPRSCTLPRTMSRLLKQKTRAAHIFCSGNSTEERSSVRYSRKTL